MDRGATGDDPRPSQMRSVHAQMESTPSVSELVQSPRDLGEHPSRGADIRRADLVQGLRHGLLDRPRRGPRIRNGARFEPQPRPPAVAGIAFSLEESPRDQPLQDPRDRARVQSDDMRELSRRQSGKLADDP